MYQQVSKIIYDFFRGRTFLPFLFSLAYVVLLILTQPLSYNENDSVAILRALEAGVETPFISLALQKGLSFLYVSISPSVPWFSILLYGLHVLGISVVIAAIFSAEKTRYYAVPIILMYLLVYSIFIIRIGYNSAAIMVGANSLFAFIVSLHSAKRIWWARAALYGVLFSFSYLIRHICIQSVIIFSAPVLAISFIGVMRSRKVAQSIFFILPVLLIISFNIFIENSFTSAQFKQFLDFNEIRGRFHGFPIASANKRNHELFRRNNWTVNDYKALEVWFFPDERKYNVSTLRNILEYPAVRGNPLQTLRSQFPLFLERYKSMLPLVCFTWLLVLIASGRVRTLILIALYHLYALGGMLYMFIYYRFPVRIGIPILMLCFLFTVFLVIRSHESPGRIALGDPLVPKKGLFALVVCCLFLWWNAFWIGDEVEIVRRDKGILASVLHEVNELPENSFLVSEPGKGLLVEYLHPLKTYHQQVLREIIPLGWLTFSPLFYHSLARIGLSRGLQLVPALVDNPLAFVLVSTNRFKEIMLDAVEADVGFACTLKRAKFIADDLSVYQIHSGFSGDDFSWRLMTPVLVNDNEFPWNDHISGKSFQWAGPSGSK